MSYNDDDIAEAGERHDINGREYSVVGNTVYVKSFFGGWKPVEDEDEEAEGGNRRDVHGTEYSLVGNKVYKKNWLGGWDEVEDDDERAEAGDKEKSNGTTYSRVGDTVYEKGLFGGWSEVDENDLGHAEGGDKREVNGTEYSVVGNTVYKKGFFGGWEEVDDDNERAEAGDLYEKNGTEYSRVGNTVYKKGFFGGWEELNRDDDEHPGDSDDSNNDDDDDDDYSDTDYSSGPSGDYSSSNAAPASSYSPSSSKSSPVSTWVILLLAGAGIFTAYKVYMGWKEKEVIQNYSAREPHVNIATAPPVNPYGEGNGRVSFYKTCTYCPDINVLVQGTDMGKLPSQPLQKDPSCSGPGMLTMNAPAGLRTFTMVDENGATWEQEVEITERECVAVKVVKPEPKQSTESEDMRVDTTNSPLENQGATIAGISIISPQEHASFDYPRYTDIEWTAYENADQYEVEFQLADSPFDYAATSFSPMPYDNKGIYYTANTTVTVQGMGKQVHRFRIKAYIGNQLLYTTGWRYISYTN